MRSQLLIVITVVLAAAFGVAVWETATVQREMVAMTTCWRTADAARTLLVRSQQMMEAAVAPVFAAVGGRAPVAPIAPLAPPSALAVAEERVQRCHCATSLPVGAYFRLDAVNGNAVGGALTMYPAGADSAGLRDAVTRMGSSLRADGVLAAAVTRTAADTDTLRAIAVLSPTFGADGQLRAVYGIMMAPAAFASTLVGTAFNGPPLISLYDGHWYSNRELVNLQVVDNREAMLYKTGEIPAEAWLPKAWGNWCVGMAVPTPRMARIMVHLGMPPSVGDRLTLHNIAASRVPLLAALLISLLACGAAAALASRREGELAALREQFVASVSHELRMPLAHILLSAETLSLQRARSQSERDDAADAIVRETQRLASLVDNVLFFSRIEHHTLTVTPEPVDLAAYLEEIVCDLRPLADAAGVTLVSAVAASTTAFIDPRAFRQVLYNLVDNAIKYGPRGQCITIGAGPAASPADSAGPARTRIWVADQGFGIPPGNERTIFEPFMRLERERGRSVAGSGLGLAVVRELVQRHEGQIWVEPVAGTGGTLFVIDVAASAAPVTARASVWSAVMRPDFFGNVRSVLKRR
ncbi:MAG TPA: HAMP domain-containing sensor histidine kinase [Gemmatimonadaceae bacterium]|nr:HAMP domain-containing sensor histidine kinase [Gemmatimonadaceae bacterium]